MSRDTSAARELLAAVLAEIAPEADLASVSDEANLRDEIELDSMDMLNLVIGVAERTGRVIPERDYGKVETINAWAEYLAET
jgi:acyl carrier protein